MSGAGVLLEKRLLGEVKLRKEGDGKVRSGQSEAMTSEEGRSTDLKGIVGGKRDVEPDPEVVLDAVGDIEDEASDLDEVVRNR